MDRPLIFVADVESVVVVAIGGVFYQCGGFVGHQFRSSRFFDRTREEEKEHNRPTNDHERNERSEENEKSGGCAKGTSDRTHIVAIRVGEKIGLALRPEASRRYRYFATAPDRSTLGWFRAVPPSSYTRVTIKISERTSGDMMPKATTRRLQTEEPVLEFTNHSLGGCFDERRSW